MPPDWQQGHPSCYYTLVSEQNTPPHKASVNGFILFMHCEKQVQNYLISVLMVHHFNLNVIFNYRLIEDDTDVTSGDWNDFRPKVVFPALKL